MSDANWAFDGLDSEQSRAISRASVAVAVNLAYGRGKEETPHQEAGFIYRTLLVFFMAGVKGDFEVINYIGENIRDDPETETLVKEIEARVLERLKETDKTFCIVSVI